MPKDPKHTLESLQKKILSYEPDADLSLLRKAYYFSHEAHCSQKRIEGSPFIGHPLAVASILADMHMDHKGIIAGLLHDTVEDTGTRLDDIKSIFGPEVAFLVGALTKLSRMEFKTREDAQAENFRKMFLAMADDIRVIIIKFADRLHNMSTLEFLPAPKQRRIASETLEVYAPLANRLGIGWLKTQFEDLSFRFLMPEIYNDIARKVAKRKEAQEGYMNEVAEIIKRKLSEEKIHAEVSGRVKHVFGIHQKMLAQRIAFDQVHDVLGLRIITDSKSNCYAVLGIIHSLWTPIPGRFKDYIAMPKSNLYQSLHTTVIGPKGAKVEFQIRTHEMHMIAEEGIASHWVYKEKGRVRDKDTKYIAWMRELVKSQKDIGETARDFVEAVKGEVMPEVVYVLTPQGEIKELPSGSTPVDFAYSIHSEVGHSCVGAKVDGRIVPLRYQLRNGDTVEIIRAQSHGPSKDWLKFVATQRAKNRIKQWIKNEESKQRLALGTKMMETELKRHGIPLTKQKSKEMDAVLESLSLKTLEDLYVAVGSGKISPHQVANRLLPPEEQAEEEKVVTRDSKVKQQDAKGIRIKGIDNILYHTAKCCYPIPGDNLVGFITKGKGVTIHRRDCPNLERIAVFEEKMIDVDWFTENSSTSPARLLVETIDKPGILANLTALISSEEINISHLEATSSSDRRGHLTFILQVKNLDQLSSITGKISSSPGVLRVKR